MKPRFFIAMMLIALAGDWIVQRIWPGWVWLAPFALIIGSLVSRDLNRSLPILVVAGFIADLFSGYPLGIVSGILYAVIGSISLVKTRIRFRDRSLSFLVMSVACFCGEFYLLLYAYTRLFRTTA